VGSGNVGATNVSRALGKTAGVMVLVIDVFKGYAACAFIAPLIFDWLAPHASGFFRYFHDEPFDVQIRFYVVAGVFAVLGHDFTCWLKFKGGKGIATSAGVFLALAPLALGITLGVWMIVFALGWYVSVASIAAAVALPAAVWILPPHNFLLGIATTALGLLAIAKHKGNIERLLNGTERRFGERPATPEATK
jgi:glycerol-3-phosphate acyltransferase PlsY